MTTNPRFRTALAERGLTSAAALFDLPGEVVSGHPDRHVVRVELPGWGGALYLKRQHRVGWRERLRQRLAGFGWASRCEREAKLLRELDAAGFACPSWVAFGEDGYGRAFLLLEELSGAVELRQLLSDNLLSPDDRRRVAERFGQAVAELHAAGFDTPDLTAKHVFVDPTTFAVTLIDWQSARRVQRLGALARGRALGALHASLADHLASPADRTRVLWAYRRVADVRVTGRDVRDHAAKAASRRSVRDQRQPVVSGAEAQRLVWVAGEAVCAVPDVAAHWPRPATAPPFYLNDPIVADDALHVRSPGGRIAVLIRGRSFDPVERLVAWVRGRAWRSPGATLGRVLFHLQRYGVTAPHLLAFGQRLTGRATADWFALHGPPAGVPLTAWLARPAPQPLRRDVLGQVGLLLRQLHDAGCRYTGGPLVVVTDDPTGKVSVGGVQAVRIVRKLPTGYRRADLLKLIRFCDLGRTDRLRVVRGYFGPGRSRDPDTRRAARRALSPFAGGRS